MSSELDLRQEQIEGFSSVITEMADFKREWGEMPETIVLSENQKQAIVMDNSIKMTDSPSGKTTVQGPDIVVR